MILELSSRATVPIDRAEFVALLDKATVVLHSFRPKKAADDARMLGSLRNYVASSKLKYTKSVSSKVDVAIWMQADTSRGVTVYYKSQEPNQGVA
jgi:hypothetical protein